MDARSEEYDKAWGIFYQKLEEIELGSDWGEIAGFTFPCTLTAARLEALANDYKKVLKSKPYDDEIRKRLGLVLFQKRMVNGDHRESKRTWSTKTKISLFHPRMFYGISLKLYLDGHLQESIKEYKKALSNDRELAKTHRTLQDSISQRELLSHGQRQYMRLSKIGIDAESAFNNLEFALETSTLSDDEIELLREKLLLPPASVKSHEYRGVALHDYQEQYKVIDHDTDMLSSNPYDLMANLESGIAYAEIGFLKKAIDHLCVALHFQMNAARDFNLASSINEKEHETGYESDLIARPNSAVLHQAHGISLAKRGFIKEAIDELHKAELKDNRIAWNQRCFSPNLQDVVYLDETFQRYEQFTKRD